MSKQTLIILLAWGAFACISVVAGLSIAGAGTAALYVTAFGATVLACGLEYLRKAPG